ncbi:MAG: TIGR03757 family integrating conjugative element protein [Gilliamella apicola]|nr:TIGR03757 family integrating conjugative element protein [Gilliamella apicola]
MRKKFFLLILIISFQVMAEEVNGILVFVTQTQSKQVVGCYNNCEIHILDASDNILQSYFGDLPNNSDDAYPIVIEKINSSEWNEIEKKVDDSQKIIIKAFELGISKYPAIVINQEFVSYGTTDVNKAINDFYEFEGREIRHE